ncbi:MAG: 1-deoxy-D-xylulose-5-phosphate reductoisomerase, partial [Candidatus Dormibacteria bacterium]
ANEAAVAAFLGGGCRFDEIVPLVERTLDAAPAPASPSLDELVALDAWARAEVGRACAAATGGRR